MIVWTQAKPLDPTAAALPWQPIGNDWHGRAIEPAADYLLLEDPDFLWLCARHGNAARAHPGAGPGDFQEGLWRHDVAELFIAAPDGKAYLEFNLSPRGAWWGAAFAAARQAKPWGSMPAVQAAGGLVQDGWQARLGIPLDWLRCEIGWGGGSRANVTFILESPAQRFLSAAALPGVEPDFHQPDHFAALARQPLS